MVAEQRGGAPIHGFGGVEVAVGAGTGDAAEKGSLTDLAAVELDRPHIGRRRVAVHTDHADVVDQCGHLHS